MPQFLVTLYDGTDAGAPARRKATMPAHLDGQKGNVASGRLIFGGGSLISRSSRSVHFSLRTARIGLNWMR